METGSLWASGIEPKGVRKSVEHYNANIEVEMNDNIFCVKRLPYMTDTCEHKV